MRTILGCALAVLFAVAAGAGADDKIDVKKLVGKWEPKESKKDAKMVLEFTKDGKVRVLAEEGGKELKFDGTYKIDGNKLEMALKFGENEIKDTVTVTKLTDEVLEGESSKGKKESFKRVQAK